MIEYLELYDFYDEKPEPTGQELLTTEVEDLTKWSIATCPTCSVEFDLLTSIRGTHVCCPNGHEF